MSKDVPLLVTSALPYANGPAHLGHLVEQIQTDVFVRFNRLLGREVLYVCAADTHGTPIEVNARKLGVDPAEMVERFRQEHARDSGGFGISWDIFYTTHSEENREYAARVFESLKKGGYVFEQSVEQFFCETDQRFLPDRFVKGSCPNCGAADQYGDVCERCNKTYEPVDLREPFCVLCGNKPVRRSSTHYFVRLGQFTDFLRSFADTLQPEVRNYVTRWLDEGLKDWCVSRDGPYFGFQIPDTDKFFYVWLDAPIGYISSLVHLAKERGFDPQRFWPGVVDQSARGTAGAEVVHFIGKDIVYFHTLFWPAMLHAAGFALPAKVHVHGMLNMGGAKMSKSRGRMITAREWLDALDPSYLRYYLAANLGPALDDIEFSQDELRNRVNSQLVNNIGNLVNRTLKFAKANFEGRLSQPSPLEDEERAELDGYVRQAKVAFAEVNYREAVRHIEAYASWFNEFLQNRAQPWKTIKTDRERAQADVTLVANAAKALATLLAPIVPRFSEAIFQQLGIAAQGWDQGVSFDLADHSIGTPEALLPPLDAEVLEKLFAPKEAPQAPEQAPAVVEPVEPLEPEIVYDDFAKIDLRVGLVVNAEKVPKADKLLKVTVDVGEGEPRTIAAGIALSYQPEELVGRRVVVVANLAPRKLRGIESRGMLLAASGGPRGLTLAEVPEDAAPGSRVK